MVHHNPGQEIIGSKLVPSTEHQWHQQPHPATVCSPCCRLTTDTEVSAAIVSCVHWELPVTQSDRVSHADILIRKSVPTLLFLQETQQYAEAYTKKVRNNSRIHPFTHTKCLWYLFLAETNPRSKFFPSIKLTSTDSSGAICVYLNFLRIFWLVSQNWCKYLFIFLFWLAYKICCIKKVLISLKESYIVGWHRPNNVNITHSCFAIMLFFQLSTKASVSVLNMCSKCWFTEFVFS